MSSKTPSTPQALRFARHLVLVAIVACVNPFWILGAHRGYTNAVSVFLGAIFCSAVVTGLALLFFTNGTGKDWPGNFIRALWVFALLILLGLWTK
jgi:lysylphosphatidylglycerol synthetase-like protein (DUF2156 family)